MDHGRVGSISRLDRAFSMVSQAEAQLRQTYPGFQGPNSAPNDACNDPPWFQHQETRDPSFRGTFSLRPVPSPARAEYLKAFLAVQHGYWPVDYTSKQADPLREAVILPLGADAAFFVGHYSNGLRGRNPFVHSCQGFQVGPGGQPHCGICPWHLSEDASQLKPDNKGQTMMPMKWLGWLVTHFLQPWQIEITGKVFLEDPCTSQEGAVIAVNNCNIWAEINQSGQKTAYCIVGGPSHFPTSDATLAEPPVSHFKKSLLKPLDPVLLQTDYTDWLQRQALHPDHSNLQLRQGIAFSGLPPDPKARWVGVEVDGRVIFFNGQTVPTKGLKRNQEYFQALPDNISKFFLATVEWAKDKPDVYSRALAAYNAEKSARAYPHATH